MTIFVAGATGAVGQPLCRLLVADGFTVVGMTRSTEKAGVLASQGVTPVVVDPGLYVITDTEETYASSNS